MDGFLGMIPCWKIVREIDRAGQQLRALAGPVWEPFVQRRHDGRRAEILNVADGAIALRPKVAVYLLYQPKGKLASTLLICRHFVDKGDAPFVISNTPLPREGRDPLNATAWKTVVRPSYGYDFGGYRDGILSLANWNVAPERLIILNDRFGFPIGEDETFIDRMEAPDTDLGGAVIHPAMRRRPFSTKRRSFLESYFYLVKRKALNHPAYARYWRDFRVSSNKFNAIYRGERGFSHALEQAGLRLQGVLSPDALYDAVAAAGDEVLRKTLIYAAYTDPDFIEENRFLLVSPMSEEWRAAVLDHVRRAVTRRSFHASFPYASVLLLGAPYIKTGTGRCLERAYGTLHSRMRRQYMKAVAAGDLPYPFDAVLNEVATRDGLVLENGDLRAPSQQPAQEVLDSQTKPSRRVFA